jgi:hypothetical protein
MGGPMRFQTLAKSVTPDLACLHEVEYLESKIGNSDL